MRAIARQAIVLVALISVVSLLTSCASPAAMPTTAPAPFQAAAPTTAPAARAYSETAGQPTDAASQGKQSEPAAPGGQTSSQPVPLDRMIIRTSVVQMTVKDVEAALASIRAITVGADGYVASSSSQNVGGKQTATVALQLPAQSFDGVLNQVRKLAVRVDSENTTSQDVTDQFVDLQSQVSNLKAAEASEVRLLDKATTMSDILAIQRELTSLRGQIEQAQGRINYYQRKTDFSSLTIQLTPESADVTPLANSSWQPLRTIGRAWQSSLQTLSAVADVVLAVVVFLWWLIPIVAVAVFFWRRQRRRRVATAPSAPPAAPPSGTP